MSEASPEEAPVDIADLRRRLGLPGGPISQSELGRRCKVSASIICRYESDPSMQCGSLLALLHKMLAETMAKKAAA